MVCWIVVNLRFGLSAGLLVRVPICLFVCLFASVLVSVYLSTGLNIYLCFPHSALFCIYYFSLFVSTFATTLVSSSSSPISFYLYLTGFSLYLHLSVLSRSSSLSLPISLLYTLSFCQYLCFSHIVYLSVCLSLFLILCS